MQLSERTITRLCTPFSVCPIIRYGAAPFVIGLLMIWAGFFQQIDWLKTVGFVLTLPIIWVYLVIMFVFPIAVLFEKLHKR